MRDIDSYQYRTGNDRRLGVYPPSFGDGTVHADDLAFRQILLNPLSNAVKFTPDGDHVDIAIADGPEEGTAVSLWFPPRSEA